MPDADKLDRLLTEAGDQWRATQAPAPRLGAVWRAPARTFDLRWGWVLAAAALIAVLAGSLVIGGGQPHPSPVAEASNVVVAWDAAQLRAAEVRPGDLVTATGILMAKTGESPRLCAGAFDILMFGIPPSCSPPEVPLSGSLDPSSLPGRQVVGDVTFSSSVRVVGRWTGTAIEGPAIAPAPSPGYEAPLPCPTPATGWANPATSGAFRAALDPLAREVTAHPELYAGYYTQPASPGNDAVPAVEVVRTKVDPRTLVSRVAALFPFAVCLTRDYSQAELDAVISAFPPPPASIPAVSGDTHRVGVQVTAVDGQTLPLFLAHPAAYPVALVTKNVGSAAPEPTPTSPPRSPSATPAQSSVLDIPSTIDGEPVLTGAAARAAVEGSIDSTPFLVGAYLTAPQARACPIDVGDAWNPCLGLYLLLNPWGGPDNWLSVHLLAPTLGLDSPASGDIQAIVVKIHTHDPACPDSSCRTSAVLDSVVWYGRTGALPQPTSTRPPTGLSEADAVAAALREAAIHPGDPSPSSALAGPYAIVGSAGSGVVAGDRWVWALTFSSTSGGTFIVLDYVTGEFLIQETPAPVTTSDAGEARTILEKYLESISGRYWDVAWGYLSAFSQRRYGSERAYIDVMTAGPDSSSSVQISDPVPLPLSDLVDSGYFEPGLVADVEATVVTSRAFFISTVDPSVDGASAGSSTYVVAALSDTEWRIWLAH